MSCSAKAYITPSTDETAPKVSTTTPHQTGISTPPSRSAPTLMMPNTPILTITPDIMAEACEGAAGCALGSQPCRGSMPAFAPKPKNASKKAIDAMAGEICA